MEDALPWPWVSSAGLAASLLALPGQLCGAAGAPEPAVPFRVSRGRYSAASRKHRDTAKRGRADGRLSRPMGKPDFPSRPMGGRRGRERVEEAAWTGARAGAGA